MLGRSTKNQIWILSCVTVLPFVGSTNVNKIFAFYLKAETDPPALQIQTPDQLVSKGAELYKYRLQIN